MSFAKRSCFKLGYLPILVSWGLRSEVAAIILQFTGGLLVNFGLIVCFDGVAQSDGVRFAG
jgi:hypothetical protein